MFRWITRPLLLPLLLALIVVLVLSHGASWPRLSLGGPPDTHAAVQFLRREDLSFLVTARVVTQVIVERRESNFLLGQKEGFLVGTVELLYGVDLSKLDPSSFATRDGALHVRVPEPTLLRAVIDEDSLRFMQKRSPLFVIIDNVRSKDLFQDALRELGAAARAFAESQGLAPTRDQLIKRLGAYAPVIELHTGVRVVFE